MTRVLFSDGMSVSVETHEGLVQLVTRTKDGAAEEGQEFTPAEAHRLGEALIKAAFAAPSPYK